MSDHQTSQPPHPMRGGALDALRFAAALFVVVFHFGDEAPVALQSMHGFMARGYLATDFFLMLSGFVLALAYGDAVTNDRLGPGRFWIRRFVRVYPTHFITLCALMAMVALAGLVGVQSSAGDGRFDWSGIPSQVLLLHAFGQGAGHWNIPSWSISTLLVCYAAFPLLWRAMQRIDRPAAALALGLIVLVSADLFSRMVLGFELASLPGQWCLLRAAPLFVVGLTLARAVRTLDLSAVEARAMALGGGAVFAANALAGGSDMIGLLAICAVIMGCGARPVARPIPGAAWGARISFSLFMVHTLTGAVWFDLVEPLAGQIGGGAAWAMWLGAVIMAVLAGSLYERLIDAPIQRALKARLFGRPTLTARPAPRPAPEPSA